MLSSEISLRVVLAGHVGAGIHFEVTTQPPAYAIVPNNKETFTITFYSDGSDSTRNATATIASDDPANPEFIFHLIATAGS